MCNSIFFLYCSLPFQHTDQQSTSFFVPLEKNIFVLSDKPCIHCFFHLLVVGEMAAFQRACEWTNQVMVGSWMSTVQRMLLHPRFQLAEAFSGVGSSVLMAIIMLHRDTF
jgi:hypothetical protein